MLVVYVFGSLHFTFIHFFLDKLKCFFDFLFKGRQTVLYFCALQCGIDSYLREKFVTIVSEVRKFLQRLVLICCHRHTLCVGSGVASIALKSAATALFLAFDTVVLRYGATTAAPCSCHQIRNTLFNKFITTIRHNNILTFRTLNGFSISVGETHKKKNFFKEKLTVCYALYSKFVTLRQFENSQVFFRTTHVLLPKRYTNLERFETAYYFSRILRQSSYYLIKK